MQKRAWLDDGHGQFNPLDDLAPRGSGYDEPKIAGSNFIPSGPLRNMLPDPVRSWNARLTKLGAKNSLTIGIPDPPPQEIIDIYTQAVATELTKGSPTYPPVKGEPVLLDQITRMENNFGEPLKEDDRNLMYVTAGASGALQFVFSLFQRDSGILVQAPGWGTVYNMVMHSRLRGLPCEYFP